MGSKCHTRTGGKSRCTGSRFGKSMQARNGAARRSFSITSPPCNVPQRTRRSGGWRRTPSPPGPGRGERREGAQNACSARTGASGGLAPGAAARRKPRAGGAALHKRRALHKSPDLNLPLPPPAPRPAPPPGGVGWDALPPLIFPSEAHLSPSLPGLTSPD